MGEVNGYSKSIGLENIFKNFYGKRKNKAKMQNPLSKFHKNSFQSSNFAFVHSSSLCFKFIHHRTPLVRWSLHKYKYLWDVESKGQGSNLQKRVSLTYTLRLE